MGTFECRYRSWRTDLVSGLARKREEGFKKARLTIGGQLRILAVMLEEEERHLVRVKEEMKCAQRLMAAADNPRSFPGSDRDQLKDIQRDMKRSSSVRVGGGFVYQQEGPDDVGLDELFQAKSAVPWTANSETMAVGPKFAPAVPSMSASRAPKLPPTSQPLPPGTLPPAARARARRASPARGGARQPSADRAGGPKRRPAQSPVARVPTPRQLAAPERAPVRAPVVVRRPPSARPTERVPGDARPRGRSAQRSLSF